jgi:hypothetical protein
MRSALVTAVARQSNSIRYAIACGRSMVMRLVGRSERGWVTSFMSHFYTYCGAFQTVTLYIYHAAPRNADR